MYQSPREHSSFRLKNRSGCLFHQKRDRRQGELWPNPGYAAAVQNRTRHLTGVVCRPPPRKTEKATPPPSHARLVEHVERIGARRLHGYQHPSKIRKKKKKTSRQNDANKIKSGETDANKPRTHHTQHRKLQQTQGEKRQKPAVLQADQDQASFVYLGTDVSGPAALGSFTSSNPLDLSLASKRKFSVAPLFSRICAKKSQQRKKQ